MKQEAEMNAEKDRAEREKIDKLNQADSLVFQTEKQLNEYGDKIPAEKKGAIEDALGKLKTAHQSQDMDGIDSATAELNTAWQAASQDMYAASQDAGAAGADPNMGGNPNADAGGASDATDAEDVEFEEVDEKK